MELNEAQLKAVEVLEGPLLILAGAGSGKTRTLTERIARIITEGHAGPHEILAITFTNKAAGEMQRRLSERLGMRVEDMWIMTFHRACLAILRREAELLGFPRRFAVYDTSDQLALMRAVVKELRLDEERFPPSRLLTQVSRLKGELKGPEDVVGGTREGVLQEVFQRYQERLKELGAMDFDDLIGRTVELFESCPEVLASYQERFRYIHVDEYQDTNPAQYRWLRLLTLRRPNLAVVGDPDQAIYGWRGADVRNILEFERDFPGARVVVLDRNYRSTRRIVAAANAVVRENIQRVAKELWTDGPEGSLLHLYEAEDGRSEADAVARTVAHLVRAGRRHGEVAVLVRTNGQTRALEEAFLQRGIPYRLVAGVRFYERAEVKDVLAYLQLLVRPGDEIAFARAVQTPRRGVGEATVASVAKLARELGVSLLEAIDAYEGRGAKALREFRDLLADIALAELPLSGRMERLIERSGLKAMWEALPPDERQSRLDNVRSLLDRAREAEREGDDLETFLDRVALMAEVDEVGEGQDAVLVLTMHAAKGLEFPVVCIPGLEEGILPHARSLGDAGGVEEERRLCYVALTRAQEELYLFRATRRLGRGGFVPTQASRFLKAIPPELFARTKSAMPDGEEDRPEVNFGLGERVIHPVFGLGVVVARSGVGEDAELKVAFPGRGLKDLLVRYAGLRRAAKG